LIIRIADIVKQRLGAVSLSDVHDISEVDKDEIRLFLTRLKKSRIPAEVEARKTEIESLIRGYEDKRSEAEGGYLQEKYQNIADSLQSVASELDAGNITEAVRQTEESLFE
jgi:predicted transcriptional regulator of viral defense system